jgi:hypothetical protein
VSERITGIEVPDDAVVIGEIAIVTYLDDEGKEIWAASVGSGSMAQSQIVGLLELTKNAFLQD